MDGMKVQAGRARASVYFIMVLFLASGCNGGGNEQPPPAPVSLTALTPDSATAGSAAIEISAAGAGFTTSSVVQWNGASLTTNYVSPTALTAIVPTTDLATADNIAVTVSDASSGGASSGVVYFTISTQTPPMITALAPSSMTAGGAAFQLVINGTNFDSSATVLWNGRPIPTAFDSSTQLTAQVTAVQIASAAEIPVTVVNNPSPGGTSNSSTFTVANAPPVPTLISLSPNSIPAYSGPFTLTITGTGFTPTTLVSIGNGFFQPTYVSPTQITLSPTYFSYASGTTLLFTVQDASSGNVNSNALPFTITPPIPVTNSVSPANVLVDEGALTVTVTGQYFTSTSVVYFNGSARPTTMNARGQLVAQLSALDVAATGTDAITVSDPVSGNVASNPVSLVVQPWPALALASLSPATVSAGNVAFTLTVFGSGFSTNSIVEWNGSALSTSYISGSTLQAAVSAAQVANTGSVSITVVNPTIQGGTSSPLTLTIVAPSIDAVSYQIDNGHSGTINFRSATLPAAASWSINIGGAPSNALIVGGRVYVMANTNNEIDTDGTSELLALDAATGAMLWGPLSFGGSAGLTYDAGKIFVNSSDGVLTALDAASGLRIWSVETPDETLTPSAPVAAQGIVYLLVNVYYSAMAFSESNGAMLWQTSIDSATPGSIAVSVDGVYASSSCNTVDLQPVSGAVIWTNNTGCSGGLGETPVVASGELYSPIGAGTYPDIYSGVVYAPENGTPIATYSASAAPAVTASTAFILYNSLLRGIALSNSQVIWSFAGDGGLVTAPIVVNNYVFIGSSSGNLYALDATTGALLWTQDLGAPIPGPPAFGSMLTNATGLAAGDGILVVPAGNTVTAYVLSTNP